MMGDCASSVVATPECIPDIGTALEMCDVLTERQGRLVRDTWEMVQNIEAESAAWVTTFERYCDANKELNRLFIIIESMHDFRLAPSSDEISTSVQSPQWCSNTNDVIESLSDVSATGCELSGLDQAAAAAAVYPGSDSAVNVRVHHSVLHRHSQFIMETIGAAVESLDFDDPTVFVGILFALGQIHCTFDVKPHYLPIFWKIFRKSVRDVIGPELFTDEVESAWQALFTFVVSRMRDGIRSYRRRQRDNDEMMYGSLEESVTGSGSPACSSIVSPYYDL